jgi:hypothetical protein
VAAGALNAAEELVQWERPVSSCIFPSRLLSFGWGLLDRRLIPLDAHFNAVSAPVLEYSNLASQLAEDFRQATDTPNGKRDFGIVWIRVSHATSLLTWLRPGTGALRS